MGFDCNSLNNHHVTVYEVYEVLWYDCKLMVVSFVRLDDSEETSRMSSSIKSCWSWKVAGSRSRSRSGSLA